jgi:hypothetical protein
LEDPFAFARRQVRVFGAIVQSLMAPMLSLRQHPSNGWRVAGKLVGDHHPRLGAVLTVKHTTQEALSGYLIASVLDQDVQYDSVLVDSSPEPVAFAADPQRHLVQMPLVACSRSSAAQPGCEGSPKHGATLTDGLMADDDPAFGEEILHITKAEMKAKVEPDGVSDDLGREAVAPKRERSEGWVMNIRRALSLIPAQLDNSCWPA